MEPGWESRSEEIDYCFTTDDVVVDERRGWLEEKGKWGYEIVPGMAHKWSAKEEVEDGKMDEDGGEELSYATVGVMSCFLSL